MRALHDGARWPAAWLFAGLVLSVSGPARAQELGVTARVERPMARTGGDDPSASATEVDAQDRPRAMDTLEDAVREAPGTRTLSTGAYGSSTTLSLRGADASQTEVLYGEIPLTSADGAAFDLSTMPLWALERVEIYRGGAPTYLGVSPVGGVLRLIPRSARRTEAEGTLGIGSYGLAHGRVSAGVAGDDVSFRASVGATTSEGDFPLLDDGRTAFDPSDDRQRPRQNGFVREGGGQSSLEVPLGGGHLRAVGFWQTRVGGVPGVASRPTEHTRRQQTQLIAGLGWSRTEDGRPESDADWRVSVSASGAFRRRELTDLGGELGPPRDTEDDAVRALARLAAAGRAADWLEISGVGLYTHEALLASDRGRTDDPSHRNTGTLGVEARLFGRIDETRFDIRPSARLSAIGSQLTSLRPDREDQQSFDLAPTFRLGAALSPLPDLTLSASAATATRMPSMLELFGDRGVLIGDPSLRPERAETFDLGVVVRGRHDVLQGEAELRGFVTLASDLIRYARVDALRAVPQNVDHAMLGGAELALRGRITPHFTVRGALTVLGTATEHNGLTRQLPLRPALSAYLRPALQVFDLGPLSSLRAFVDVTYVSESFWDPANLGVLAARARFGLGLSLAVWQDRLRLDASVADLADARGTDRLGFPLPGRTMQLSATLRSGE